MKSIMEFDEKYESAATLLFLALKYQLRMEISYTLFFT